MRAHSSYFRRKNSKKGLALSTTMAICIILAILVSLLVSMASLNITTTQATVNQREAYVQAKSAIAFAESYYLNNNEAIPGSGNVGEGLIIFKSDNIGDGACFYETKSGTTTLIDDTTVEQYIKDCKNTYIRVKNSMGTTDSLLTMTAYTKYGKSNAYELSKEYVIGGHTNIQDNAFTGSINYQTTNETRYVRFHVRATTALGGAPYFYMWYNGVSPKEGTDSYNAYATSSIENKLTFNYYYKFVENGSWDATGPKGECAMSYEGGGWYVTQKTFNLTRNLHFVNGIITKTGANRSAGDDQQSWEFFGIPIPNEDELGASKGVDVYFELNKNELKDMKNSDYGDRFTEKYRSYAHNGDSGHTQLNDFVKYCSEYYTVYTKSNTAIMHYRKAGETTNENGPGGFEYEGYGWWRSYTHNFADSFAGYSFGNGSVISSNQYGTENVVESFVVEDKEGVTAQFPTEEEANAWLIKHGDLSAANYTEINVKSIAQPVDPDDGPGAIISYDAIVYSGDQKVPTYDDANFVPTAAGDVPEPTPLDKASDDDLNFKKVANAIYGNFYIMGNMNGDLDDVNWSDIGSQYKLESDGAGEGTYSLEMDCAIGDTISLFVIQSPDNIYINYGGLKKLTNFTNFKKVFTVRGWSGPSGYPLYYGDNGRGRSLSSWTNYWGDDTNPESPKQFTATTNRVKVTFDTATNLVSIQDVGIGGGGGGETPVINLGNVYSVVGWMNNWGTKQDGASSTEAVYSLTREMQMYSDVDGILTYSDGTLIVESGKEYRFKIAERLDGVDEDAAIDWTHVYNADGTPASTDPNTISGSDDDETAVLIQPPLSPDGKKQKYYVTITYGPNPKFDDNRVAPDYILTPFDDIDKYYVIGEFSGWDSTDEVKDTYDFNDVYPYELVQVNSTKNDIIFQYKLKSVKEAGHYEVMVVGSLSSKVDEEGNMVIDYTKAWGANSDTNLTEEGGRISLGEGPKGYDLSERSNVLITFTYHKNDPTTSEITVTPTPVSEDETVERVHVGFHNGKVENVNDSKKNSKFETPWENVYITYYTEETGLNCFLAKKADEGLNWWWDVPVDAEYVFFSNKRSNVYRELHSEDFEYTVDIKAEEWAESYSTIFFPITPKEDDEKRTMWTVGDSQDYYEYVNTRSHVSETKAHMAYYGSTQCNYYDAPFVNVLNMILTGDPKPSTKYAFASYPWSKFKAGSDSLAFSDTAYVTYQGEKYYYCPCGNALSYFIVCNPGETRYNDNYSNMYGYLFEDQMSLERNGGNMSTYVTGNYRVRKDGSWRTTNNSGLDGYFRMDNRAGGTFVSDVNYRNGDPSPFNYGGYTPSWYTYRIPVSNDVTIKDLEIVTAKNTWSSVVYHNTNSFVPVRESTNVNRPLYFYLDESSHKEYYTYNINQGVVDGVTNSDGSVTTAVYFDNCDEEPWSKVSVCASDPLGTKDYFTLGDDPTTDDNNYYRFQFDEGKYTFFQFYDGDDNADGLKNAEHKSSVLYLTGEELITDTEARYSKEYAGMDSRATKTLCKGSATGFSYYIHPRMEVMRAYLDMDTVSNMTTNFTYYTYNNVLGTYSCYDQRSMSSFTSKKNTLERWYKNGNNGSGKWTANGLENYGDGLLEAASEFMDALSEARIYISEDISNAPRGATAWAGNDVDKMVYLEGEQLQDSAFEYTSRWVNGLKNLYKRYTRSSYHKTSETGRQDSRTTYSSENVYANEGLQNASTFRAYTVALRQWLDNPQATIKKDAVRIIVDDTRKTVGKVTRGGWGKNNIHLYVKDPDTGWQIFASDILTTTQTNFYAFVFMLPTTDKYYNAEFAIADKIPQLTTQTVTLENGQQQEITKSTVDGVEITTVRITSGNQYRFNTCYALDDPRCFSIDTSVETKCYSGNDITKGDNSPTSELNQFVGMTVGKKFVINFKYDTTVSYDGKSYLIYAGCYTIDEKYAGFYTDFNPTATAATATRSGIDLYTENARRFFREKNSDGMMNYGMVSATDYIPWTTNRVNSGKPLDIMVSTITKSGDIVASESDNRVNFRSRNERGNDTFVVDRNITLKGSTVTIASNVIDFSEAGSCDFYIESGTFIFLTDTEIVHADGSTALINHGTYVFNTKNTDKKSMKVGLKSTSDPTTDWRSKFALVSDVGSELQGGKFIANN